MRIYVMPALLAVAVLAAPTASAAPKCVQTGPTTTQCASSGHTQIVTSPPVMNNGPFYGWPYGGGGIVIGLG